MIRRPTWLLIHRYIGLVMAFFLLVSGLTGSLLAFYDELDTAVNAQVMTVTPPSPDAQPLDPLLLREQIQARYPAHLVSWVTLALEPGHTWTYFLEGLPDPDTGEHADIDNDTLFVNPYTGDVLGARKWGDITQGPTNLMPFIYRLHYSLALGTVGEYLFGIVALLWTLDCFVGAYLTFPASARKQERSRSSQVASQKNTSKKHWLTRWWQSWTVRWKRGSYKVNFDLHRAGGLWPWAMLLVLAWSSVGFNLQEVYRPVMGTLFEEQTGPRAIAPLSKSQLIPGIPWTQALEIGQGLMETEARRQGFDVLTAKSLSYDHVTGMYRYRVESDRDVADHGGATSIWFDANTGKRQAVYIPTGLASGDTISTWLFALHMAAVGGVAFQIFVSVMGVAVAMLSITGVVIWWKKRASRQQYQIRQTKTSALEPSHPSHPAIEWESRVAGKQSLL